MRTLRLTRVLAAIGIGALPAPAHAPNLLNYQGRVTVGVTELSLERTGLNNFNNVVGKCWILQSSGDARSGETLKLKERLQLLKNQL